MTFLADRLAGKVIAKVTGRAFKILVVGAQNQAGCLMVKFTQLPVLVAGAAVLIQWRKALFDNVAFITPQTAVEFTQVPTGADGMVETAHFLTLMAFRAFSVFMA